MPGVIHLNDFIRRRIARQPRNPALQALVALACVAVATAIRVALTPSIGNGLPYITYFPAVMVGAIVGGGRAGLLTLLGSTAVAVGLFIAPTGLGAAYVADWIGVATFLLSGGLILWLCGQLAGSMRDLTEAHNQEHLLVLELQHRVKNTLAIVQALAAQTFSAVVDPKGFKDAFTDRLIALGRAHNVLSESAWREVTLRTLVRRTVEPFVGEQPDRLRIDGADLDLPPDLVVDIALCLHELGANATKHGALSTPAGQVDVSWRRLDGERVELSWTERHGPRVEQPSHRGFGSRLLERGLSRRVRPAVVTDYRPEGLRWVAEFDAAPARS